MSAAAAGTGPAGARRACRIVIASGKGGTGKTTVAVNLARACGGPVQVLDCDVEAPNAHLFLRGTPQGSTPCMVMVPEIDAAVCDGCGECARLCAYNAIAVAGTRTLIFPELCHSCGGCVQVCPRQAIREIPHRIGDVETQQAGLITLTLGRLDIGVAMAPPLIRAVQARAQGGRPVIIDAPPGTSCPAVTAVRAAEYAVLVTEPTPFGLHDVRLAVAMTRTLGVPCGVVVNRAGSGDERVQLFCQAEAIPLLLEIPDDRRIAEAYARGALIFDALPEYRAAFVMLWDRVQSIHHKPHE